MKRTQAQKHLALLVVAALTAPAVHASGLLVWQMGTPSMGTAGAGWAAMPEDAATAFTNPAGTVWREQIDVRAAANLLYGDIEFHNGGLSNVPGSDGGNPLGWFPTGGAYAAGRLSDNLGWGFAAAGNFGGTLDYHGDWQGRRFVQDTDLIGMSLIPSLSWKVNDCLSIGIGANVMGVFFQYESAPRAGVIPDDASLKYKDLDVGYGGNLGLIYRPVPSTTFGVSYTSKVDVTFTDDLRLRNFGPLFEDAVSRLDGTRTAIDMTVPATVTASLQQELQPGTSLYANLAWQDWSDYSGLRLELDNPNQTSLLVQRGYKDTGHFALGLRQEFTRGRLQGWYLSTGIAYDSGMTDDATVSADTVTGKSWQFGLGVGTELCPGLQLDIAYNLNWLGDIDIDQQGPPPFSPRLEGTYRDSALHFIGGSVQFGF